MTGMELEAENHAAADAAGGQDGDTSSSGGADASSSSSSPLFSIALVCQSNVNRSMEAHALLLQKKLPIHIESYGVGQRGIKSQLQPSLSRLRSPAAVYCAAVRQAARSACLVSLSTRLWCMSSALPTL
jgi:hypothetical protein